MFLSEVFSGYVNLPNAQFLPAARRLPQLKVRLEYKHHLTSEHNLNYTLLHRLNQFRFKHPFAKSQGWVVGYKIFVRQHFKLTDRSAS